MVDTVNTRPLELECYPMTARPPDLVPGRQSRNWLAKASIQLRDWLPGRRSGGVAVMG